MRLQRYAIAIIAADKSERERRGFEPMGKSGAIKWMAIPESPIISPAPADGERLELLSLPRGLEDPLAEASIFWRNTFWSVQGPPTTWLEIYALFRLWGGGNLQETQDVHTPSPTFQHGLNTFIKSSKADLKIAGTSHQAGRPGLPGERAVDG